MSDKLVLKTDVKPNKEKKGFYNLRVALLDDFSGVTNISQGLVSKEDLLKARNTIDAHIS